MDNSKKKEKYAILMGKLKKATDNEYYYEAIFLEYAILEDRMESLLKHANLKYKEKDGKAYKLMKKINKIKSCKEFKDKYIEKHIPNELLDKIIDWKRNRDKLMHNCIELEYENNQIKDVALYGECLIKRLNTKTKLVNKDLDKSLASINNKNKLLY